MKRLPIKTDSGLRAGCNFACASWLLGLIGGASRIFNDHKRSMGNGAAFRAVVCDYFPWEVSPPSDLTPNKIAGVLWKVFRNPLPQLGSPRAWRDPRRFDHEPGLFGA